MLTEDALLDRVRAVCAAEGFTEAVALDFSKQPAGNTDGVFIARYDGQVPIGGLGFNEEARGVITILVQRAVNGDPFAARRAALQDGRALLNAIARDGAVTSGEYAVDDAGRGLEVDQPSGASYLVMRLRASVNFEATL